MGVGTHIKDRQETGDACNADKSSSQLLNAPVRNEKLTICVPPSVSVCVYVCSCKNGEIQSLLHSCLTKQTHIKPVQIGRRINQTLFV